MSGQPGQQPAMSDTLSSSLYSDLGARDSSRDTMATVLSESSGNRSLSRRPLSHQRSISLTDGRSVDSGTTGRNSNGRRASVASSEHETFSDTAPILTRGIRENEYEYTPRKSAWSLLARAITLLIPNFFLRWIGLRTPERQQAWREKILLFSITLLLSGIFVTVVDFVGALLSPPVTDFSIPDLAQTELVAVNGRIADFSKATDPVGGAIHEETKKYAGSDVSSMFPTFTLLSHAQNDTRLADVDLADLVANLTVVDNYLKARLERVPGFIIDPNVKMLQNCPSPDGDEEKRCPCFTNSTAAKEILNQNVIGYVVHDRDMLRIQNNNLFTSNAFVIINHLVYDVTTYLRIATEYPANSSVVNASTAFLPPAVTTALLNNLGGDATGAFEALPQRAQTINVMNKLFFAGVLDEALPPPTFKLNPILLAVGALVYLSYVIKIFMTLSVGSVTKLGKTPYNIFFIPVYNEEAITIQRSIESVVNCDYDASKKLLFIVVDGLAVRPGSYRDCATAVMGILGYAGKIPQTHQYISIGRGARRMNAARVYSGTFTASKGTQVPYIVVVKAGLENETALPGTRGKRDSMLILLEYLKCMHQQRLLLTSLQNEIYSKMTRHLNLDPTLFQYVTVVDGDTFVEANAVKRLVAKMERNENLMAIHGQIKPVSNATSFATWIQGYPWYHLYHLAPAVDSAFGTVGRSWAGGFAVYRINFKDSSPCIINERVLEMFSEVPETLHKQNAIQLGEDKYLPRVLLRVHPSVKHKLEYSSSAVAYSDMPSSFGALIAQQRRSFNVRFHILWDMVICRETFIPTRVTALVELISMMLAPVATIYLCFLGVRITTLSFLRDCPNISLTNTDILISIAIGCLFGLQLVLYIAKLDVKSIAPLIVYIAIGIPIFQVFVPLYSFWRVDYAKWSDTVLLDSGNVVRDHGADIEGTIGRGREKRKFSNGPTMMARQIYGSEKVGETVDRKLAENMVEGKVMVDMTESTTIPGHGFNGQMGEFRTSFASQPTLRSMRGQQTLPRHGDIPTGDELDIPIATYVLNRTSHALSMATVKDTLPRSDTSGRSRELPPLNLELISVGQTNSINSAITEAATPSTRTLSGSPPHRLMFDVGSRASRSMATTSTVYSRPPMTPSLAAMLNTDPASPFSTSTDSTSARPPSDVILPNMSPSGSPNADITALPPRPHIPSFRKSNFFASRFPSLVSSSTPPSIYSNNPRIVSDVPSTSHYLSFSSLATSTTTPYRSSSATTIRSSRLSESLSIHTARESASLGLEGEDVAELKKMVMSEVYYFLGQVDLNTITRREIDGQLEQVFGNGVVEGLRGFIGDVVEEFTLESLALV